MPEHFSDEFEMPVLDARPAPLHGYRGASQREPAGAPTGLTIAISREAGSRGGSIAHRAGVKLGWEVYTQEMLEFGAQNPTLRDDLLASLSTASLNWIDQEYSRLLDTELRRNPGILELAHL